MEVSEYLVGSPAFKAGDTGDPRMAGSIPVHLRHDFAKSEIMALVLGVIALLMLMVSPVGAQARLLSSSPLDGASVAALPEVVFEFDSLLIADGAEVSVTKLDGTMFPVDTAVDGRVLTGTVVGELPSGNYEVGYSVRSADGDTNTGSIRVGVDAPDQALSGGLLAVLGIAAGLVVYLGIVFRADVKRRQKQSRRP